MENNSEVVRIGKAIHEEKAVGSQISEIAIDNIKLDKLTKEYLTEIKKSDADPVSSRWQLLYYLKVLKKKGIIRKGKLEFVEKNRKGGKVEIVELTEEQEQQLKKYEQDIEELLESKQIPPVLNEAKCKKCAYYEYCYI